MTKVRYWSLDRLALMITKMLMNQFDAFIIFEGNRGLGKSTLAYQVLKKISNNFRILVRETGRKESPYYGWYEFKPQMQLNKPKDFRYIIYKQEDVINFYDKWHKSAIADEMINVAFNREFWSENQKNLIKMMNMNRDHGNLLVACVPQFQNLDTQIKNLCKIRVTVVRRGLAVIQTPNRTIYNKDRWDTANNERIEREWLKKGTGLPQYSKLNTFRGLVRFKDLSTREKKIYETIKFNERNIIKSDLGVTEGSKKELNPEEIIYEKLVKGGVRNGFEIEGVAIALGITGIALRNRLQRRLAREQKPTALASYFWDKRAKQQEAQLGIH